MPDGSGTYVRRDSRPPALPQEGEPGAIRLTAWVEIEQQVLGSLLLAHEMEKPERIDAVLARGGAALFHDPCHAEVFRVIAARHKEGALVSPVTLANIAPLVDTLEPVGGAVYLVRMAGVALSNAFPRYVDVMAENRDKRILAMALEAARADLEASELSPADVLAKFEATAQTVTSRSSAVKPVTMLAAVTDALTDIHAAYHGQELPGVGTGVPALHHILGTLGPGEMTLLGGRPGMGKTGIALSIAKRAAMMGHPVVFGSFEMVPKALVLRSLSEGTSGIANSHAVSYSAMKRGDMTEEQFRAVVAVADEIQTLPIYFLNRKFADCASFYAGARAAVKQSGLTKMPLLILDYIQIMRAPGASRFEEITKVSMGVKDTAMRMECPVLALSQLSRQLEMRDEKRPVMADLRESGQLEQDADNILFAFREVYYHDRKEPDPQDADKWAIWKAIHDSLHNRLEIIVAKQRQGSLGTARVRFNPALNLIWEDGLL